MEGTADRRTDVNRASYSATGGTAESVATGKGIPEEGDGGSGTGRRRYGESERACIESINDRFRGYHLQDSSTPVVASPTSGSPTSTNLPVAEAPASILKAAAATANTQPPPPEPAPPPPPPERGSSYAVMSLRSRDTSASAVSVNVTATKRVSFDTPTTLASSPSALQLDETTREDPNVSLFGSSYCVQLVHSSFQSFIRQAESMLASPTTPTVDSSGIPTTATPGVIGAQEVYRDPRARRLAEQAQQKTVQQTPVPEKLSFKEKMKMFAMETGETGTPRDKSKISKAQREIDNLSSPPNMVH